MLAHRPLIIGYDAVSPLGTTLDQQWERAAAGESGLGPLTRFPVDEGFPVEVAGQVPDFDHSPYPFLSPRQLAHWRSPVFPHALLVVHRALTDAGIEITPELAPRVAVTFSTAIGGLDAVIAADRRMVAEGRLPHPFANPNSCINMVAGKVSILTGATGPITTTITACATGATSMIVGSLLLASDMADVVICGAVDFPLVEPIVAGFATMNGAFKRRNDRPHPPHAEVSRPFATHRRGFVVSEGAAALILCRPEFAQAHGLDAGFELAGWGTTADAKHFVAPNQPTVARCISNTLDHAGIALADVDSINAHAASTKAGDSVEVEALNEVAGPGQPLPPLTANKSQLGHCMGASSAVETVLALEGMRRSMVLPTLNYEPDPQLAMDSLVTQTRSLAQEQVLKNAFGFGGCNACLLLRRRH